MQGCFRITGYLGRVSLLSRSSLLLLLLLATTILLDSTNALTIVIPDKLRLNQRTGQPRACSVIGGALHVLTRVALLGGSTSSREKFQIEVKAESNRAALQGNLKQVSIRVQDSKSPWLEVDRLEVEGSNLQLGWMPLIVSAGLPLTLFVRPARRLVWTFSCYYYMWTVIQKVRSRVIDNNTDTQKVTKQTTQTPFDRFKRRIMGGEPSELRYTVVLSNNNLANSALLKQCCKFLLRSLMQNSVLQTAAIVGDAVNENNKRMIEQNTQTNARTNKVGELAIWQQQQQQQQPPQQSNNNELSKLLSATSFEMLEAPTFREGKYLQFVSQAVLPDDQGRLDFVLRTKIRGGGGNNNNNNNNDNDNPCLLQFVQSECRFDVKEATSYLPLPSIVSNFLPKVIWLPVGSGIGIGGQSSADDGRTSCHSIQNAQVLREGKCRIQGRLSFLQKPPSNTGGLVRRR